MKLFQIDGVKVVVYSTLIALHSICNATCKTLVDHNATRAYFAFVILSETNSISTYFLPSITI